MLSEAKHLLLAASFDRTIRDSITKLADAPPKHLTIEVIRKERFRSVAPAPCRQSRRAPRAPLQTQAAFFG